MTRRIFFQFVMKHAVKIGGSIGAGTLAVLQYRVDAAEKEVDKVKEKTEQLAEAKEVNRLRRVTEKLSSDVAELRGYNDAWYRKFQEIETNRRP